MNLVLLLLTLFSCSASRTSEKRCESILKNDYKNLLVEDFKSVVGKDTIYLREVKFECVYSSFYTKKVMYDRFGKWDQAIFTPGGRHPILVWENLQLFTDENLKFMVAANGMESRETIYASVIVFDENSRDMLSDNSGHKQMLIDYFSDMIRSNDPEKRDFYEIYWEFVDPAWWEHIQQNKGNS